MFYNHDLRVNLKEWRNRILKSRPDQFQNPHKYFLDKVASTSALIAYLNNSSFQVKLEDLEKAYHDRLRSTKFNNEEHEAVFKFAFIHFLLDNKNFHHNAIYQQFGGGRDITDSMNGYVECFIDPIVNYLEDQLDEGSSVLYPLEKYKSRCEWFHQDRLRKLYLNNSTTGEDKLDEDLRMFLFDQGIDYPFSTPKSSSGRADIVGLLHTKDPLVLEVKIYDESKNYRKNRIADGFSQIVKYASDYNKNVGYLVIFNLDPVNFTIEPAEKDKAWPNRVCYDGKNFYIIFINLWNEASASKSGKIKNQTLAIEDLISEIR